MSDRLDSSSEGVCLSSLVPYTIWLRAQALNNTTSGLLVNLALTDSTGASVQGWGWVTRAYWLSQPTTLTFAGSGSHTLRIQAREDGVQFDRIVLSPTYLKMPPGPASDATIVPKP